MLNLPTKKAQTAGPLREATSTILFSNCCRSPRGCSAHGTGERPPHNPKRQLFSLSLFGGAARGHLLPATSAPLVLFLALHRRLRFPRRLQALWEANDTPVYGGCQYFNAIYCISILTHEMRLSRAAFSTTYV